MIVVVGDYVPDKSPVYKSNATVVAAAVSEEDNYWNQPCAKK